MSQLCTCLATCVECSSARLRSHGSLILSLSAPNGAARGTALYYLSGPVNSTAIIHRVEARACEQVSPCTASLSCTVTCQHNTKETSATLPPGIKTRHWENVALSFPSRRSLGTRINHHFLPHLHTAELAISNWAHLGGEPP